MKVYNLLCVLLCIVVYCEAKVSELKIETLEQKFDTCQRKVQDGDQVHVHYTGTLLSDGSKFDSSYDRQQPFVFQVGRRQVIPGWEQGLLDMCVGEKRKLTVPSHLAYGEAGAGDKIPPNADLVFEVELITIEDGQPQVNVFKLIDTDNDNALSPDEVGDYLKKQIPRDVRESNEMEDFDEDKMVLEIFEHEDKDKNGYISHEEFSGPKHDEL
ncbi:FK506-binding protein 2A [Chamberlinius hualienensis]